MHEFYYQNRKWSHFEGIYRLWSYQSHLQLGGNQIHLHFCKNYWFSESEMIQVPIHVIPKLKYDHALLLFETLSTVSKKEILIFFLCQSFSYGTFFHAGSRALSPPWVWAGVIQFSAWRTPQRKFCWTPFRVESGSLCNQKPGNLLDSWKPGRHITL